MSDYLLLFGVIIFTCAGQLCQKKAAQQLAASRAAILGWIMLALTLMGCALLGWLRVLQHLPLSVAYPLLSLNFVLIALGARFCFGETLEKRHWLGIVFIMLGVTLMGIR